MLPAGNRYAVVTRRKVFEELGDMAIVSRMISDLTGTEADKSEFVKLVVRQHPAVDEPKSLDVLPSEIVGLEDAGDLVVLELFNGQKRQFAVTLANFRTVCPDEIVRHAPGTRGRRPGFRPHA
jgi:hypothetical protein